MPRGKPQPSIQLQSDLKRLPAGIDITRQDIYQRHQHRQKIDSETVRPRSPSSRPKSDIGPNGDPARAEFEESILYAARKKESEEEQEVRSSIL